MKKLERLKEERKAINAQKKAKREAAKKAEKAPLIDITDSPPIYSINTDEDPFSLFRDLAPDLSISRQTDLVGIPFSVSSSTKASYRDVESERPPPRFNVGEYVYPDPGYKSRKIPIQGVIESLKTMSYTPALDEYVVKFLNGVYQGDTTVKRDLDMIRVPMNERWIDRRAGYEKLTEGIINELGSQESTDSDLIETPITLIPSNKDLSDFILGQNERGRISLNDQYQAEDIIRPQVTSGPSIFQSAYTNPGDLRKVFQKRFGKSEELKAAKIANKKKRDRGIDKFETDKRKVGEAPNELSRPVF
jgi:hypothetical protein